MEDKRKHLELIQAVITRMAGNSFLLKGWAVTLVSALFALAAKDSSKHYVLLTYIPATMFWILDGYFLRQEKLFRKLYDGVRLRSDETTDYSMDTAPYKSQVPSWFGVMISGTLLIFYGALLITVIIVTYFMFHVSR
jgi:hypothetical protein